MGCDIHIYEQSGSSISDDSILCHRNYGMFGFLANVRNYSKVPCISPARGLPEDVDELIRAEYEDNFDVHTASWLTIEELLSFDYNQTFEDRRINGDVLPIGEGKMLTIREFLGEKFIDKLKKMKEDGVERIIFWFDN